MGSNNQRKRSINLSFDLSSINWVNILPQLGGKKILKFGTKNGNNIKGLINLSCELLLCVGSKRSDISSPVLNYSQDVENLRSIETNFFDLCVIDEEDFFKEVSSFKELTKICNRIYELLNNDGILMIGLPNTFHSFKSKLFIKKIVRKAGFEKIDIFICRPSFSDPLEVYPFSSDENFSLTLITKKDYLKKRGLIRLLKGIIKYVFIKVMPMIVPFMGIGLMVRKSKRGKLETIIDISSFSDVKINSDQKNHIYSLWLAKHYIAKQIGLLYYGQNSDKKLLAVCKKASNKRFAIDCVRQEYDNLMILSDYRDKLTKINISFPTPFCFKEYNESIWFIETALAGEAMEDYKLKFLYKEGFERNRSILDELIYVQACLQDVLSKNIKDNLNRLSKEYFANSLGISYPWLNQDDRTYSYKHFVQHGDFTDVNIIYDSLNKTFGIIDWESLSSGYPPIFDLFSFFTSFEYHERKVKKAAWLDSRFYSFIDTFYKRTYFSDYITNVILNYCEYFYVDKEHIFDYFLDFLMITYNKYTLKNWLIYANLYKQVLYFSVENKDRFIIKAKTLQQSETPRPKGRGIFSATQSSCTGPCSMSR
jgi:hypothetical protein